MNRGKKGREVTGEHTEGRLVRPTLLYSTNRITSLESK